jgi:orotate phosphoribosyltransferase
MTTTPETAQATDRKMMAREDRTRQDRARRAAEMLLDIEAVHFNADELYTFTSGLKSPVYIDCRKIISFPEVRSALNDMGAQVVREAVGPVDTVAGGETAGIPFAAWIADRMLTPMAYVRKQPKGFGRGAQIEGEVPEGKNTLLVEDLTTDGASKIKFAQALRDAGAQCGRRPRRPRPRGCRTADGARTGSRPCPGRLSAPTSARARTSCRRGRRRMRRSTARR